MSSCDYWWNRQPAEALCRVAFQGTTAEGEACLRSEECAGDRRCVVTDECPGTCRPRAALGQECMEDGDCDDANGRVTCWQGTCEAVTVLPPAGEGEPCRGFVTKDDDAEPATLEPCAAGLWCDGDGIFQSDPPGGPTELRRGSCRGDLIAAGAACRDDDDLCEDGYACVGDRCELLHLGVELGGTCDQTHFCDFSSRLGCVQGVCESFGLGTEGIACREVDFVGFRPCEPGLQCIVTTDDTVVTSGTPRACLPFRTTGEKCAFGSECASQTCGPDWRCEATFCENGRQF